MLEPGPTVIEPTNHSDDKSQGPKASRRMLEPTATATEPTMATRRARGRRLAEACSDQQRRQQNQPRLGAKGEQKKARTSSDGDRTNRGDERSRRMLERTVTLAGRTAAKATRTDSHADSMNRGDEMSQRPKRSRRILEPTATQKVRSAAMKETRGRRQAVECSNQQRR